MLVVAPDIQEWTIERRSRPSTNWTTRTSSTWPQLRIGFISRPPPVNRIYYRHVLVDWAERCLYTSICSIVNTWCVKLNTSTSTVEWFGFPFVDITKRYSISWHKQWKRRKIKKQVKSGLTVAKMAVAIQRPMASGPDPLTSLRLSSHTPKTTRTSVNVEKNSTPKPCVGVRALCTSVTPNVLWNSVGVRACFTKQRKSP